MKKITFKEIKKFTEDNFNYKIKIVLDKCTPYGAYANSDSDGKIVYYLIRIDRDSWNKLYRKNPYRVKRLMLHELGHFETFNVNKPKENCAHNELDAQLWSIRQARKIGDTRLIKECIDHFKKWETFDWNSPYRKYRLAWNRFMKGKYSRKMYLEVNTKIL
jgi:hypothetical protein